MSSSSSIKSDSTTATSTTPTPGVLWVTTSVMNKNLPDSILHDWYEEHLIDVLNCPGNGGLALRHKNIDSSIGTYADPNFGGRFASPPAAEDPIAKAGWPYLALVKLTDLAWLTTKQFDDMPRVSKLLPPASDGSMGSAFDAFHAGLRSYETVERKDETTTTNNQGRAKYLISLQTIDAEPKTFDTLEQIYSALPGYRCSITYKLVNGLLEYEEPGPLPKGLVLYEYDSGSSSPKLVSGEDHEKYIVRGDVWELIAEKGDLSLDL